MTSAHDSKEGKKSFRWLVDILFICIVLGGALKLFIGFNNYQAKNAPKTPEEIRLAKISNQFSAWDGSHYGMTKLIKNSMHDSSSYEHLHTERWSWDEEDHVFVKTRFRWKNDLGAIVVSIIEAKFDFGGNLIEIISQK